MTTYSSKLIDLEKENKELKTENKVLVEKNEQLTKQVIFYKRAVDKSFQSHREDMQEPKVVTDQKDEVYYRVNETSNKRNYAKAFLMFTIFTIMIQTVSIKPNGEDVFNINERTSQLNAIEYENMYTGDMSTRFF